MDAVNKLTYSEFIDKFGNVVQACPLVAATLWSSRPFASSDDLIEKFCDFIDALPLPREYVKPHFSKVSEPDIVSFSGLWLGSEVVGPSRSIELQP